MDKIPFDVYDFFGYLASGAVIIVGIELIFGFPYVLGQELKLLDSLLLLLAVYVSGQLVATPAKALFEDIFVGKILGRPSINLFQEKKPRIWGLLFPGFYKPFPEQTRQRILAKAEGDGVKGTGEDLFLYVRYGPVVLQDQRLMERLNSFLNKYGFSRNLSFSALLIGVALLVRISFWPTIDANLTKYAITALLVGILLFYRYLKFFRQYSYELFNVYARAK